MIGFNEGNLYFNRIYIVQSLRENDKRTGTELYEDIISRRTSATLSAVINDISSKADLITHFELIQKNIYEGYLPFIHFETHGFKNGIQLSTGDEFPWTEIVPYIRRINVLTKNNLFISMAACHGGNIQFCVKIYEPSPFRGFIGPMEDVGERDVLNSFTEFFNTLLLENDFDKAIEALNATSKTTKYHFMNVEAFFDVVLENHKMLEMENPRIAMERVDYLMGESIRRNPGILIKYGSRRRLRRSIEKFVKEDKPDVLRLLKRRFCHLE